MDARRRLVAMDEERAIVRPYTDPAVDLVVHTSAGTNGRIGCPSTQLSLEYGSALVEHARQGLTGYEQRARRLSRVQRTGSRRRRTSAAIGASCPERRGKQHSVLGGRYIGAQLMR